MNNQLSPIEAALVTNDLSKLTTNERMMYYKNVCESVGLNPLTQPLAYISLNGKLTLYAKRDATDQLRKINNVSISISSREKIDDIFIVTAKAKNADGREDESIGSVNISGLKGDALANAYMKCETKAKRRVTLSICGLGLLDESEADSIKGAVFVQEKQIEAKAIAPSVKPTSVVEDKKDVIDAPKKVLNMAPISRQQADELKAVGTSKKLDVNAINKIVYDATKKTKWSDLTVSEYETILNTVLSHE